MSRTASCTCGQLSVTVEGEPAGVGVCHCLACQRRTGSVFAALAHFEVWRATGEATRFVRVGDAGARFTFHFCPVCGTTLYHKEDGENGVSVAVGAFADPSFPPPRASVYGCRRHPWVRLPDGVRVYARDPA